MALAFTITDNGDGTGGVCAVTGSGGGTNSLYYASFDGSHGSYSWTLVGSRSGDGNITIASPSPVPLGYYLWQVINVTAGVTTVGPVVLGNLTDATTAVHYRILEAVRVGVNACALSGIPSAQVHRVWLPRVLEGLVTYPAVLICPAGAETDVSQLVGRDDVGYPVLVALVDKQQADNAANMPRNLLWRQKVARYFRWQRLAGVTEVQLPTQIIPDQVVIPEAFAKNLFMSAILFRFISREPRGLT